MTSPSNSSQTTQISTTFDSFAIFKRNAHSLYQIIISHVLSFPSLTINFPPKITQKSDTIRIPFTFSTHSDEKNFIYRQILSIPSPNTPQPQNSISVSNRGIFAGGYGASEFSTKPEFFASIPAEANASALSPDGEILAVSVENSILIFDFHSFLINTETAPKLILTDILADCFSLVFDGFSLFCGDSTGKFVVYDIFEFKGTLIASENFNAAINGVVVSPHFENLVVIATDQGELIFTDFQLKRVKNVLLGDLIDDFVGCSVAWSAVDSNKIAIGGQNGELVIYDLESEKCEKLPSYHTGAIYQLQYSPFYDLLMAGSEDSRITLWRGQKLVFVHAGHTCCVSDAKFHPSVPNLIGSVAEDNSLQFWWPSDLCFEELK